MTEGPPPTAASSSKTTSISHEQPRTLASLSVSSPTTSSAKVTISGQHPYVDYAQWSNVWQPAYSAYLPTSTGTHPTSTPGSTAAPNLLYPSNPVSSNPYAAHIYQPHAYNALARQNSKSTYNKANTTGSQPTKPPVSSVHLPTPPPPGPETYKNWDQVLKIFLVKTKLAQTLNGLERDMLVLSPGWEQKMIPESLKELVVGLQSILDRIAGKENAEKNSTPVDKEVDIISLNKLDDESSLDERKLDYVRLLNAFEPRPQSSINKSISQFLSRTRARNDASNRAEFLYTLAEKKRKLVEDTLTLENLENGQKDVAKEGTTHEITSCARVDAKSIDRAKQIKYDIAKYGEGPLNMTVKTVTYPTPVSQIATPITTPISLVGSEGPPQQQRKRKLEDVDYAEEGSTKSKRKLKTTRKGKGKAKEEPQESLSKADSKPEEDAEDIALSMATAAKHPGIDERLRNIEEHVAIRYVPSPPRTLIARLKTLEDHVIKLEKEYPPWAALHFNQPNRGWPPPPRATPVIVPPYLRTVTTTTSNVVAPPANTVDSHSPLASENAAVVPETRTTHVTGQNGVGGTSTSGKPRKTNSSLHKAVLERLEVQKAMNEIGGKGD